ncbi:MAG: ice-binding family protein, partial [Saprospiraceae bacterium]
MKKILLHIAALAAIFCSPDMIFGQAPNLGTTSTFALFTATGAFNNVGSSVVTGDVGTNVGAFNAFPPGILIGTIHVADPASSQAASDVAIAYSDLFNLNCGMVIGTTLGNNQTLGPNIYCTGAASTINGTLVLDAQGNPNALFIFKINGALSTSTFSNVSLINGANYCNVYWQVNGQFTLGDNSVFRGTVIANGAINLLFGSTIFGRALSTAGAISSNTVVVTTLCSNTSVVVTCPTNTTVQCASQVPLPNPGSIMTISTCGGAVNVTVAPDVISNSTCTNRFTITRVYTASDLCNNVATCSQTITVFDNTPPSITCPGNSTVQCASQVPAPNINLVASADNCGGVATILFVGDVVSAQSCANRFILTRTYKSTDACGNSASCVQMITVFDNTPPTITLTGLGVPNGGTILVQCLGQDPNWALPVYSAANANTTDNCTGNVSIAFTQVLISQGECNVDGYINRYLLTWTASDVCGNNSTAFVFLELIDTIPPVIIGVPNDITVSCNALPALPVITATDECLCACVILFTQSIPLAGCQNGQVITRTWTAKDRCGNMTTQTQRITLIDNEGPVLSLAITGMPLISGDTTLNFTCSDGGIPSSFDLLNAGSIIASTSCGSTPQVTFSQSGSTPRNCEFFGFVEEQQYSWTAVDQCGNQTTLTLTAHVLDTEPPVLVGVPAIACAGDPALNNIEAVDNCGQGSVSFWDVSIPNPCGDGTAIRRTYEGTDPCGNSVRDTAILIPNQFIPLVITLNHPSTDSIPDGEVLTFNCTGDPNHLTPFSLMDVNVTGGCMERMALSFEENVIQTGNCNTNGFMAMVQVTWTAVDMCNNSSQMTMLIRIVDESAPVFVNFKNEITIGCHNALPEIFASDNCGDVIISSVDEIVPGACVSEYIVLRSITLTDACGNKTTGQQTVHVGDGNGPVINGVDSTICNDLTLPVVTAFDDCAGIFVPVQMHEDTLDINCNGGLAISRTWSAVDACGHISVANQIIVINDSIPPVMQIPSWSVIRRFMDISNNFIYLSQTDLINQLNALSETSIFVIDDCDQEVTPVFTVVVTFSGDCTAFGYFERRVYTWSATDICGNEALLTFTIDIIDDVPPVFLNGQNDTTIICAPLPGVPVVNVLDAAMPVLTTFTETIVPGTGIGVFIVTRTWTATDACGNISTSVQTIRWIPNTFLACEIIVPPVIVCNSHGVIITSDVTGGIGPYTYVWEISGEK